MLFISDNYIHGLNLSISSICCRFSGVAFKASIEASPSWIIVPEPSIRRGLSAELVVKEEIGKISAPIS
jgi:hypothetical protein